jgi:alpha-ketoglutarate-dependent taurine dioxygenase
LTLPSEPDAQRPYVQLDAAPGDTLAAIELSLVRAYYEKHGALLLRGYGGNLDDFAALAAQMCPVAVHNESRNRALLGTSQNVQSVNLGVQPFPLHPELSREPWKPDSCFFYCIRPPSAEGSTTLCDGVAIVRALPPELKAAMQGRRLKYLAPAGPEVLKYWLGNASPDEALIASPPATCPYSFERVGQQLARAFSRPLLHKPMFTDALAFGNFLLFARFLRGMRNFPLLDTGEEVPEAWLQIVKSVSDRLTVQIDWQHGDLLILDNSRFLHGRTAVTEPNDRIIATYFGYLPDAVPAPEEPHDPIWRKPGFRPPSAGL